MNPNPGDSVLRDQSPADRLAFLEGFWRHAPLNLFVVYPDTEDDFRIEAINPAHEESLGVRLAEIVHRPMREWLPRSVHDSVVTHYRECLQRRTPLRYDEIGNMNGGVPRYWNTLLVPVFDARGAVSRIFGASQEVTELRHKEQELERTNAELEARVAERTRELESARAELERQARVDELTRTWNRRHLREQAPALLARCHRQGEWLAGIMLDADHFKAFNDQLGHQAGDEVLRAIAAVCQESVRADDLVFRYGGEEFLILLPAADQAGAMAVAERIRSNMSRHDAMPDSALSRPVSVSLGVAAVDPAGESLDILISRADDALRQAKQNGRDRAVPVA
jgi:diguanylate cyclase (GGDEF)-like protein